MKGLTGKTQLIGLIGWPVSHSFSPAIQNAAADHLGLDWVYVPMPVRPQKLEWAVRGLDALSFRGFNITVPHKQAIIPFLDEMEEAAQAINAVNTVVVEQDGMHNWLTGYNTDVSGFLADLIDLSVDVAGRDCLVLGAGGSARAVAYGLATTGGRVQVLARRVEQAEKLVQDLAPYLPTARLHYRPSGAKLVAQPIDQLADLLQDTTAPLIVNTTPLGMSPEIDVSIWPDSLPFPKGSFVYDLVYNPVQTKLMQQAQSSGGRSANGLGMLIQQAALAFQLWTGQDPDLTVLKAVVQDLAHT